MTDMEAAPGNTSPDALEQVLTLLKSLDERLSTVEASKPQFVKMRRPESPAQNRYQPSEEAVKHVMKGLSAVGQATGGRVNLLDTPGGTSSIPPNYRPIYQIGETVQLNPEAGAHGGSTTWGTVLQKLQAEGSDCDGVGEVLGTLYIDRHWEPKYRVLVPGLTGSNGDGFRESELLPYNG